MSEQIPAYAVGYLRDVVFGDDIIRYLREIDGTLEPFGGEFIVHGGHIEAHSDGPGMGSEFIVRLPIVVDQAPSRRVSDDDMAATQAALEAERDARDEALS